jgi:hypothetical protein
MSILGRPSSKDALWAAFAVVLFITACHEQPERTAPTSFTFQDCLENLPEHVDGLEILSGPRSEKGIIHDMAHPVCSGYALFEQMKENGEEIEAGSVVFRVVVDYVGEVISVTVEEQTMSSEELVGKVREIILNTDFVYWRDKDDTDSEFLYPVHFGRFE